MPLANYIYIDFDNVQVKDLNLIASRPVRVILVVGSQFSKLPTDLVETALRLPGQVELVKLSEPGKNAADFALAFELGQRAASDPKGFFHIVSRDKGFDALITHLKSKKILAARHDAFADIKFLNEMTLAERVARVREHLANSPANRPARESSLRSHLKTILGSSLSDAHLDQTIAALKKARLLSIDPAGKVTYPAAQP